MNDETTFRASTSGVDPDDVYRSLRLCGAVKSEADHTRTLYRLGACSVEVVDGAMPALLINGPTEHVVRNAAARLVYPDEDLTVTEIKPEVAAT